MIKLKDILIAGLIAFMLVVAWLWFQKNQSSSSPKVNKTIQKTEIQTTKQSIDNQEEIKSNADSLAIKVETPEVIEKKPEAAPKPKAAAKPKKKVSKPKKKKVKKVAQIEWEDMTYDFGTITEGDVIEHKFKFKNIGNAPLSFSGADASCGCTTPSIPFLDIAPGETGYVGVKYNSVNKEGEQKPEIKITTNAKPSLTMLYLKGVVEKKPAEKDSTDTSK